MSRVCGVFVAVRRGWWLIALLVLLVVAGSLVQYFGPGTAQHDSYVATRSLRIIVVPMGTSTAYDGYAAARQEDEIARVLATSGLPSYAARGMRSDAAVSRPDIHTIVAGLSATHIGNLVILIAHGRTPAEADAIATAAAEGLDSTAVTTLLPPSLRLPSSESLLVQAEGSASQPTRDTTQGEAAVWQILTHITLAFLAGVILAVLVGWRRPVRFRAARLA